MVLSSNLEEKEKASLESFPADKLQTYGEKR